MATNTDGGTTASLSNTPQAKDDFYTANEDEVLYFNVMSNDLGGNAKVLWSIDNTSDDGSADLVTKDVAGVCEYSELGAKVSLTSDGRIKYDTTMLDSLAAGQTVTDQFTYAIRLSNGTLSWATVTVSLTGTNDGPVAVDDTASVDEDASTSGSVATNDSDVDNGAVLAYALVDPAPTGLTFNPDGSWSFDAASYDSLAEGEELVLTIPYTVTDEHGASDTGELKITVTGTNDGPVAVDDTASVDEDASTSGSVATNDSDVDNGAVLAYALVDPAPTGLTFNPDGSWSFDAASYDSLAEGEELVLTIPYTVTDEHGASDTGELKITVTGTNDAPELSGAQAVLAGGTEDQSYVVSKVDLLTGFTDVDNGAVLAVFGLTADHGTVIDNGDGTYTINSVANYNGTVTLSYSVIDGDGGSIPATLTFSLAPVNDPAIITGTVTGTVVEATPANPGTPTATGTLLAADVDNPPNSFIAQGSTVTASGYGSYTMSAAGVWTYTVNNANGAVNALATGMLLIDTFTVQSADGTTQTITVTIQGATDAIVNPPTETGADPNDYDALVGAAAPSFIVVNGTNAGETLTGDTSANDKDIINGFGGDDTINAGDATDQVYGGDGNDIINGGDNTDTLYGQAGIDTIHGDQFGDDIYGGSGGDTLLGDAGADNIYGGSGNDTINGGLGGDTIIGGFGADLLTGGADIDIFRYLSKLDTNDTITDFRAAGAGLDQIDLSAIDANELLVNDQDFAWGGDDGPIANGLWFSYNAGTNTTTLFGDTDGNTATAEFMLTLQNFNGFAPYGDPLTPPPTAMLDG